MKDSSAPQAPNPEVTIPLQGAENRKSFDYQLGQMRTDSTGPTGSVTWDRTPVFDQAGWDKAMQDWQASAISSAPAAPGTAGAGSYMEVGENGQQEWIPVSDPRSPLYGQVTAGTETGSPTGYSTKQPNRNDFTTYDWTQKTTLSPEQQAIFDATQKSQLGTANLLDSLTGNVSNELSSPTDWSSVPNVDVGGLMGEMGGYRDRMSGLDPAQFNQQLSDAMYGSATRYLDPQVKLQQQALEARLSEQGFVPGTPGYQQAMNTFNQSRERSYADARDRSVIGGTQAGSQAFQNQLSALNSALGGAQSSGNFGLNAATQKIAQLLQQRNQPINELNAIRSGQQVNMPQGSGTSATPNLSSPDLLGAMQQQYQGELGQYGANVSANNATMGSAASLIAAYMMF